MCLSYTGEHCHEDAQRHTTSGARFRKICERQRVEKKAWQQKQNTAELPLHDALQARRIQNAL